VSLGGISNLDYTVLLCSKMAATRAFYRDIMKFPIETDLENWVCFRVGAALLTLRPRGWSHFEDGKATFDSEAGKNVAIVVPDEIVAAFGRGKRVPVVVTIDGGYQYRNTIASMGGQFLISFNAETRAATGRGAGDDVEVRLDVDDAPRVVEVPDDLAAELARDATAKAAWDKLSFSHQRAHAESIIGAKTEATRAKRVAKVLEALRPS